MRTVVSVLLALAIPMGAQAASGTTQVDVTAAFAEQKKNIEADIAGGVTYSEISQKDMGDVRGALHRMSSLLDQEGGIEKLSDAEKAALYNDQELVNNILTQAGEDSRVICRREKKVGSHRTTSQCATVAERRRVSEETTKALRENQRIQAPPAG